MFCRPFRTLYKLARNKKWELYNYYKHTHVSAQNDRFFYFWPPIWAHSLYRTKIVNFSRSDRLGLIFNKWLSKSSICSGDSLGICISLLEIKSGSFTMIINTLTFLHKMTDFFIFGPQYGLTAYIEPKLSIFRGVTVWA